MQQFGRGRAMVSLNVWSFGSNPIAKVENELVRYRSIPSQSIFLSNTLSSARQCQITCTEVERFDVTDISENFLLLNLFCFENGIMILNINLLLIFIS